MPVAPPRPDETRSAEEKGSLRLVVDQPQAPLRPSRRDWSNVVFSVAFCEEARRDFERQKTA